MPLFAMPGLMQLEQPQHQQANVSLFDPKQVHIEALTEVTHLFERCKAEIRDNRVQSDIISSFSMVIKPEHKQEILDIYNKVVEETNTRLRAENAPFHLAGKLEGESFYFVAGYYDKKVEPPVVADIVKSQALSSVIDDKEKKSPPKLEEMDLTLNETKKQAILELAYLFSHKKKDDFSNLPVEEKANAIHKAVRYMLIDDKTIENRKKFYEKIKYAPEFQFFIKGKDSEGVKLPNEILPADLKGGSIVAGDCDEIALICRAVLGSCGIKADVVQFFYKKEGDNNAELGHTTLLHVGKKMIVVDAALLNQTEEIALDRADFSDASKVEAKIRELYKNREKMEISKMSVLRTTEQIKAMVLESDWFDRYKGEMNEEGMQWIRAALNANPESVFSNTVLGKYLANSETDKAREHLLVAIKRDPKDFEANFQYASLVNNHDIEHDYSNAYESIKTCYSQKPNDAAVVYVKWKIESKLGLDEAARKSEKELEVLQRANH